VINLAFVIPAVASLAAAASTATAATAATVGTAAATASTAAATAGIAATGAAGIEAASIPLAAAAAATPWLGYAGLGLTALGGVTGALGSIQQGKAAKASSDYNADVATANAAQAEQNAQISSQSGIQQEAMQEQKTRAEVGQMKANQAASGVDVHSGSALDVRSSAAELGELDALTVRSNATREAYGYKTQAIGFEGQGQLDKMEGQNAETAGYVGAANTFLGSTGSAATNFAKYQMQGGFGY
jgi:hypothetical protein